MTKYRYRVLSAWGSVADQLTPLIDNPDAYLVYDEYLGKGKVETIIDLRTGETVGGWRMAYAGKREIPISEHSESSEIS